MALGTGPEFESKLLSSKFLVLCPPGSWCPSVVPGGCECHLCLECRSGETRTAFPEPLGFSWQMQTWEGFLRVGRAQVFSLCCAMWQEPGFILQGRAAWVEIPALVGIRLNLRFVFLGVELFL